RVRKSKGLAALEAAQQEARFDSRLLAERWRLDGAAQPDERLIARAHLTAVYVRSDIACKSAAAVLLRRPWSLKFEQRHNLRLQPTAPAAIMTGARAERNVRRRRLSGWT